jgi:HEAT repeat protein
MRLLIIEYLERLKAVLLGGLALSLLAGCSRGVSEKIDRAYELARHPNDRNKARIEAMLLDPDRDVRANAVVLMETLDRNRAAGMAATALQDSDGLVRAAAVTILAPDADAQTLQTLAGLAVSDPVWQVRARALEAIAAWSDPAVGDVFARALSDSVRHVRRVALRIGTERAGLLPTDRVSSLVVSDPDWENRVEAARALGASKDPAAYAGLDAALADSNEFVRAAAARERRALESAGVAR